METTTEKPHLIEGFRKTTFTGTLPPANFHTCQGRLKFFVFLWPVHEMLLIKPGILN